MYTYKIKLLYKKKIIYHTLSNVFGTNYRRDFD